MSIQIGEGDVMLVVRPNAMRRAVSLVAIGAVAVLLIYFAISAPELSAMLRSIMVVAGVGFGLLARRFYYATSVALELSRDALRDSTGRVLFHLDDVERLDRSAFAFKPSNGLSVHLKHPGQMAWEPGLWWRFGRRLGIGGATGPGQARAIADTLTLLQAEADKT